MPKKRKKASKRSTGSAGSSARRPAGLGGDSALLLSLLQDHLATGAGGLGMAGNPFGSLSPPVERIRHRKRAKPVYYRVRADLKGAKPPIWRRLDLASDLGLDELHEVLQAAFGWYDAHLHQFRADGDYARSERFVGSDPFGGPLDDLDGTPEGSVRLDQVLHAPGDKLHYEYDFGDDWDHLLKLEEALPKPPEADRAVLVGGRRAAPPEDCGGIYGYRHLLEAIGDPAHPEHAELSDWFADVSAIPPGSFDPARLDLEELGEAVRCSVR